MINGELIVDNFAGGGGVSTDTSSTGQSKSARIVYCRPYAKYADRSRADRTAPVRMRSNSYSSASSNAAGRKMIHGKFLWKIQFAVH